MVLAYVQLFPSTTVGSAVALTHGSCTSPRFYVRHCPILLRAKRPLTSHRTWTAVPRFASGGVRMSSSTEPNKQQPTAKDLAKLYGGSYLGTSVGMSVVSFSVLYFLVYIGVDVRSLTNAFGNWLATTPLGRPAALDNISDAAGAAAIAYVAHKVTSPLRFPLTIAATPFVARFFSKQPEDASEGEEDSS